MTNQRLWEIDCLRGLAVLAMVLSNFLFDLYFFAGSSFVQGDWPGILARCTAGSFIFLVGVSLSLSHWKRRRDIKKFLHYLKRGVSLILLGMVVTAATWIAAGDELALFGVLHLIGTSIIISYPFLRFRFLNVFLGIAVIWSGLILSKMSFGFPWLLPLGVAPREFKSVDYAPILPWWGLVLIGIAVGNFLYRHGTRQFPLDDYGKKRVVAQICFAGRHSLIVYFVHQPALLAGLWLYAKVFP